MSQFWIRDRVFVRAVNGAVYFLDTRADRYRGVSAAQAAQLSTVVQGWPVVFYPGALDDGIKVAEKLLDVGVLTRDSRMASRDSPVSLMPGTCGLMEDRDDKSVRIRWQHRMKFLQAYIGVWLTLRVLSLDVALRRLEASKVRLGWRAFDMVLSQELVSIFVRLRRYLYTAKDECLLDSLTLASFLISFGLSPTFVMGVVLNPFQSHAWVQHEKYIFNAEPPPGCWPIFTI